MLLLHRVDEVVGGEAGLSEEEGAGEEATIGVAEAVVAVGMFLVGVAVRGEVGEARPKLLRPALAQIFGSRALGHALRQPEQKQQRRLQQSLQLLSNPPSNRDNSTG